MKKFVCKSLLYLFLCTLILEGVSLSAFADSTKKLDDQKNTIEQKRSNAKQEIKKLRLLEKIEIGRLYKNQQKLENAERTLQKSERQYNNAKNEMSRLEHELDKVLVEYKVHLGYTKRRLVQMYKHKRNSYIEFLLSANDINTFLDRLYFENKIIEKDSERLRKSKLCAKEMLSLKNKIEIQKKNLENSIATIDKQKSSIDIEIAKNKLLIEKIKTDRATWERAEKDLAKQSMAISRMINQEIKRSQKENKSVILVSNTGFIRPVPGKITSQFGWRVHPIFKRKIFHSGVDIGAPYGTPIKAANSGRVMFVGWYSGYGKVIIIDHGSIKGIPTTTLYAHMSTTIAKQGQNVAQGTVIGKVGTTGYATGPHLHFEVRQKGNPTNPLNFIR